MVRAELKAMLDMEIIKESHINWSSLSVKIFKQDGLVSVCNQKLGNSKHCLNFMPI